MPGTGWAGGGGNPPSTGGGLPGFDPGRERSGWSPPPIQSVDACTVRRNFPMSERGVRWLGAGAPRLLMAGAIVLVGLMVAALPAAATDAFPTTNDQATTIAVARWWY